MVVKNGEVLCSAAVELIWGDFLDWLLHFGATWR
jgi:hypothetical protein